MDRVENIDQKGGSGGSLGVADLSQVRSLGREPTSHYKAGLAFLAWLNGLQDNYMLVNREDRGRDTEYQLRTAELAAAAGVLGDAGRALNALRAFKARSDRAPR